jgi:hypothetical protein
MASKTDVIPSLKKCAIEKTQHTPYIQTVPNGHPKKSSRHKVAFSRQNHISDEKEILGYRDALNVVHESFEYIPITPNYILQLHKIMFSHTGTVRQL